MLSRLPALQGCRAQEPWPLWEAYTKRFRGWAGRVSSIAPRPAPSRTAPPAKARRTRCFSRWSITTSRTFEQLLSWTEANLAGGDLTARLPAWDWGHTSSGEWKVIDDNSASDADLWMAYTLLEAGRLWHDPRYAKLGQLMAARIAREEVVLVPGLGTTLAPGPHGFHPSDAGYIPQPELPASAGARVPGENDAAGPVGCDARFTACVLLNREMDARLRHGLGRGRHATACIPCRRPQSRPPARANRSRRAATTPSGCTSGLGLPTLNTPANATCWRRFRAWPGTCARRRTRRSRSISAGQIVVHAEAPVGFSAAVVPYLTAEGMKAQAHTQVRPPGCERDDPASGLYGRSAEYYEQNLALFSTGWSEGKFRFDREGKLHLKWK